MPRGSFISCIYKYTMKDSCPLYIHSWLQLLSSALWRPSPWRRCWPCSSTSPPRCQAPSTVPARSLARAAHALLLAAPASAAPARQRHPSGGPAPSPATAAAPAASWTTSSADAAARTSSTSPATLSHRPQTSASCARKAVRTKAPPQKPRWCKYRSRTPTTTQFQEGLCDPDCM